jgi:hypothetical protein
VVPRELRHRCVQNARAKRSEIRVPWCSSCATGDD